MGEALAIRLQVSPLSDEGRGLKPLGAVPYTARDAVSPLSDEGRGLKLRAAAEFFGRGAYRPSAMRGVD